MWNRDADQNNEQVAPSATKQLKSMRLPTPIKPQFLPTEIYNKNDIDYVYLLNLQGQFIVWLEILDMKQNEDSYRLHLAN